VSAAGEMSQLRFHFGERDRDGDGPLDAAVMDACARRGVRAAALLRGVEGFGGRQRMRTERLLSLSEDAPLVAVAVGEAGLIEALAEEIGGMASGGLMTTTDIAATSAGGVAISVVGAPEDEVKVTIWGPRSGSGSPHLGAVASLKRHGAVAATVLLGLDGVLDGERRRARFVGANREVPAMTVAVGERAAINAALAELDTPASLVTVEAVESYSRIAGASHHTDAARRVTLVTSEIAAGDSQPLYLEFISRLRAEGAPGATALRGVWGFSGDREPHGDRVLALRRDVPLLVETVDVAERAAHWAELASSLAGDAGLVHLQAVPQTRDFDEPR
jgi:PII-like signaling protein